MYYALVNKQTNIVDNVIVLEDPTQWIPPEEFNLIPLQEGFGINDSWDGVNFIKHTDKTLITQLSTDLPGGVPNVIG